MDDEEDEFRMMEERRSREIRWRVAVVGLDIFVVGDANDWRGRRSRVQVVTYKIQSLGLLPGVLDGELTMYLQRGSMVQSGINIHKAWRSD